MNSRRIVFLVALAAGCGQPAPLTPAPAPARAPAPRRAPPPPPPSQHTVATAILHDLAGRGVGTVGFTDSYGGLLVTGDVNGVGLGGHAIHIHEVGKCEPPFASAGGHFNPTHRRHGFKNPDGPHLGDLPNITTPAAGRLRFDFIMPGVTLRGANGILNGDGSAIIIDSSRDDYITDPTGDSGGRIACGVIVPGLGPGK